MHAVSYGCVNCINARLTICRSDVNCSRFSQDVIRLPADAALLFPGSHVGWRQGGQQSNHARLASEEGVDECRCRSSRKGDTGGRATMERHTCRAEGAADANSRDAHHQEIDVSKPHTSYMLYYSIRSQSSDLPSAPTRLRFKSSPRTLRGSPPRTSTLPAVSRATPTFAAR